MVDPAAAGHVSAQSANLRTVFWAAGWGQTANACATGSPNDHPVACVLQSWGMGMGGRSRQTAFPAADATAALDDMAGAAQAYPEDLSNEAYRVSYADPSAQYGARSNGSDDTETYAAAPSRWDSAATLDWHVLQRTRHTLGRREQQLPHSCRHPACRESQSGGSAQACSPCSCRWNVLAGM